MLLTVDVGNTNITLGIFSQDKFINEFRLASDRDMSSFEYANLLSPLLKDFKIDGCIIASVVEELNLKLGSAIKSVLNIEPLFVSCELDLGFKIKADNPYEIGADRLANASAVAGKFNYPIIVVDFGTATTFDIINCKGEFCGGVIAPGLNTQLKCLKTSTSKLPKIDVSISSSAIGHNTVEAILSGVIRGSACMVDGLLGQCELELGQKPTLIATGGYSGLIATYMTKSFDCVNSILTLEGLKNIYLLNKNYVKKK